MKLRYRIKKRIENLEFRIFVFFLRRFCRAGFDQWAMYRLDNGYGPVYVTFSLKRDHSNEGAKDEHYISL